MNEVLRLAGPESRDIQMKIRMRLELSNKEKWRIVMAYFRENPQKMIEVMPKVN